MSSQPSFQALIYSVSAALAASGSPEAKVEDVVQLITLHLGSVTVSTSLQASRSGRVAFAERQCPSPFKGRFVFVRQIVVRGSSYGRFNLEVDTPTGGASAWLVTLETITQLLATYAEGNLLEEDKERLLKSARALEEDLRTEKTLARAAGILAVSYGHTITAARQTIVAEARNRGLAIFAICDQIILHHTAQGQLELPSSSSGQRARKDWVAA